MSIEENSNALRPRNDFASLTPLEKLELEAQQDAEITLTHHLRRNLDNALDCFNYNRAKHHLLPITLLIPEETK